MSFESENGMAHSAFEKARKNQLTDQEFNDYVNEPFSKVLDHPEYLEDPQFTIRVDRAVDLQYAFDEVKYKGETLDQPIPKRFEDLSMQSLFEHRLAIVREGNYTGRRLTRDFFGRSL